MTHICFIKLTITGSDFGLSPGRRQAIIWTTAGLLLSKPIRTNFSEILIEIHPFSMHMKISSEKSRSICLGINVLNTNIPTGCVPLCSDGAWLVKHIISRIDLDYLDHWTTFRYTNSLSRYKDTHSINRAILGPSCRNVGNSHTGKAASLYIDGALIVWCHMSDVTWALRHLNWPTVCSNLFLTNNNVLGIYR